MIMIIAVVGKGGVGKTSVASAIALELSRIGKTLIVSTDFMPSLRFIFSGGDPLTVMELSEEDVSSEWEKVYGKQVLEIAGEFMEADDEIVHHISSAPGVPEEFMISSIIEQEKSGAYDFIVWDTPASSSTMHLLALE
ncbi:arsenite transporting ATPase, partial [mine drainage metagenome]